MAVSVSPLLVPWLEATGAVGVRPWITEVLFIPLRSSIWEAMAEGGKTGSPPVGEKKQYKVEYRHKVQKTDLGSSRGVSCNKH